MGTEVHSRKSGRGMREWGGAAEAPRARCGASPRGPNGEGELGFRVRCRIDDHRERETEERKHGDRTRTRKRRPVARKKRRTGEWESSGPSGESGREEQRDGEDGEGSAGGAGGEGGEKSDVEGSGPGVGGWFIKCSKVQVEKVRMDLTCLRRR